MVSNNAGVDDWGLGLLLSAGRLRRVVASYVGENKEFARQYLSGELEVELTPQGTLAERMRAGGSGIPAYFTPTGVGTQVADGGLPWKYAADGTVEVASAAKQTQDFDGRTYVLERAIVADFALVRAWKGDRHGNLVFKGAARNFNPLAAMAGRTCLAEVEQLVEPGDIDPNDVHPRRLRAPGRPVESGTRRRQAHREEDNAMTDAPEPLPPDEFIAAILSTLEKKDSADGVDA